MNFAVCWSRTVLSPSYVTEGTESVKYLVRFVHAKELNLLPVITYFVVYNPFQPILKKINTCKRFKSTANNVATYQQQISFVKIWFLNILNKWVENFFDMHIRHKIPHSGTYQLNRSLSILRLFLNSHFCPYLVLKQGCPIHETYGKAVY